MPTHLIALIGAIVCEVTGTMALQASHQFTKLGPSTIVVAGYGLSFYLLSIALKVIPVGVAYAIWSGLGVFLIAILGWVIYGQKLDLPAVIGLAMIVGGVLVLQLLSGTATHG